MRMMAKREKASLTYRDSSYNDVEILGGIQGSGAPRMFQSTVSPRSAKRAAEASFARRHRYNYRDDSYAEYGNYEFVTSTPDDKNDKDISDAEVVEKSSQKSREEGLVQQRERGSATSTSSAKRTSVRSANKHHSQLLSNPASSTKRKLVISANK